MLQGMYGLEVFKSIPGSLSACCLQIRMFSAIALVACLSAPLHNDQGLVSETISKHPVKCLDHFVSS